MAQPIIEVKNLSKEYIISHNTQPYYTLRDSLTQAAKKPFELFFKGRSKKERFLALKDINFSVQPGEVLGIIGRNGAGKSTLLKILSQITPPTRGSIHLRGRVASLLEVGTGFHPELTGRENIFLNGAILGMTQKEIRKKFDEIVNFAGIEKFLDTPVKRYSSGQYVRLAFAVAAHLEPEILVIDEVLAVGDAEFQKKCLGKMNEISKDDGRTVLFVSHNMGAIQQLCKKALLIERGRIKMSGRVSEVVSYYLSDNSFNNECSVDLTNSPDRLPRMKSILTKVELKNSSNDLVNNFSQDNDIFLQIYYDGRNCNLLAGAGFIIYSQEEVRVGGGNTYMMFRPPHELPKLGSVIFKIDKKQFTPGCYSVTVSLGAHEGALIDKVERCISFVIEPADIYETGYLLTHEDGVCSLSFSSKINSLE